MFNPKNFVKTAAQTWDDKVAYDEFIKANEHLAMPFHVEGLESILPHQYPGQLAVYVGRSHHGKSTALRDATFKAQKRIEGRGGFVVGLVSLEDTSETTAAKQVKKYEGNSFSYQDDQFVFVGNSFKMSMDDMTGLDSNNIVACLDYGLKRFADNVQYSAVFIDYEQAISPSPELKYKDRREQVAHDVMTFFHAAKHFMCPVGLASQALIKTQRDNYVGKMKIPGQADLKEAGELYEIPDIAVSYWFPKIDYPIGEQIKEGNWSFEVTKDLVFVRVIKWRNADLLGFVGKSDPINRVFPCRIREDGSFYYEASHHKHLYLPPMQAQG
jgi:hypothetical protein